MPYINCRIQIGQVGAELEPLAQQPEHKSQHAPRAGVPGVHGLAQQPDRRAEITKVPETVVARLMTVRPVGQELGTNRVRFLCSVGRCLEPGDRSVDIGGVTDRLEPFSQKVAQVRGCRRTSGIVQREYTEHRLAQLNRLIEVTRDTGRCVASRNDEVRAP